MVTMSNMAKEAIQHAENIRREAAHRAEKLKQQAEIKFSDDKVEKILELIWRDAEKLVESLTEGKYDESKNELSRIGSNISKLPRELFKELKEEFRSLKKSIGNLFTVSKTNENRPKMPTKTGSSEKAKKGNESAPPKHRQKP